MTIRWANRTALLRVGLVAGPLAAVLVLRTLSSVPAPAAGYVAPAPALPPPPAPASLTPAQQRTSAWLAAQPAPGALVSPMDHVPLKIVEAEANTGLKLTAVLGTPSGGVATINRTIYRIGDRPLPGCRITAIDPRLGTVEITHDNGTTTTLGPQQ